MSLIVMTIINYAEGALGREIGPEDCAISDTVIPILQIGRGDTRVIFRFEPNILARPVHYAVSGLVSKPDGCHSLFQASCSKDDLQAIKAALTTPKLTE